MISYKNLYNNILINIYGGNPNRDQHDLVNTIIKTIYKEKIKLPDIINNLNDQVNIPHSIKQKILSKKYNIDMFSEYLKENLLIEEVIIIQQIVLYLLHCKLILNSYGALITSSISESVFKTVNEIEEYIAQNKIPEMSQIIVALSKIIPYNFFYFNIETRDYPLVNRFLDICNRIANSLKEILDSRDHKIIIIIPGDSPYKIWLFVKPLLPPESFDEYVFALSDVKKTSDLSLFFNHIELQKYSNIIFFDYIFHGNAFKAFDGYLKSKGIMDHLIKINLATFFEIDKHIDAELSPTQKNIMSKEKKELTLFLFDDLGPRCQNSYPVTSDGPLPMSKAQITKCNLTLLGIYFYKHNKETFINNTEDYYSKYQLITIGKSFSIAKISFFENDNICTGVYWLEVNASNLYELRKYKISSLDLLKARDDIKSDFISLNNLIRCIVLSPTQTNTAYILDKINIYNSLEYMDSRFDIRLILFTSETDIIFHQDLKNTSISHFDKNDFCLYVTHYDNVNHRINIYKLPIPLIVDIVEII